METCEVDPKPGKKLLFCCDLNAESVLLLMSFIILYIGLLQFFHWFAYFCIYTAVTQVILITFYELGGFLLLYAMHCKMPSLCYMFLFIMTVTLITNIIHVMFIFVNQECLRENVFWALTTDMTPENFIAYLVSLYMTVVPGINFIVVLYICLFVADYIAGTNP